jgi:hypothetical protein
VPAVEDILDEGLEHGKEVVPAEVGLWHPAMVSK